MRGDSRQAGYRLLGRGFDYLLLLRPAAWPILTLHFLTGSTVAVGVSGLSSRRSELIAGTLAFVIGLSGGTLALNSAFDRDRGDIAYLDRPPAPPRGLAGFGLALMLAALAVATRLPTWFFLASALSFLLSVLYSVPPIRLKGVAGLDWLVNFLGFGFLMPYAGWALTGQPLTAVGGSVLFGFAALFGALYPLTQLYQLAEDRTRGDRTLAVALGATSTFGLALSMSAVAFLAMALGGFQADWGDDAGVRWVVLLGAALGWAAVLLPWWIRASGLGPAGAISAT